MIKNFAQHSANEVVYLAWIRTAVALIAFGFLMERFNFYMAYLSVNVGKNITFEPSMMIQFIGISFILLGFFAIIIATIKYLMNKKEIDTEEDHSYNLLKINVFLSIAFATLTMVLIFYLYTQTKNIFNI